MFFCFEIQTSNSPRSSPQQHSGGSSSTASLLLVCQDPMRQIIQPPDEMEGQANSHSLVFRPPFNQHPAADVPMSNRTLVPEQKWDEPDPSPSDDGMDHIAMGPIEVKEEAVRENGSEEACVDAQLEDEPEEAESCKQGGEELDISFDSHFPDLISDFITEEANPITAQSPALPTAPAPAAVFPTGVRYMVPPQPSPSSSFLPFPHPLPSSSSSRLASITDFSPEWSYPEVTNEQQLLHL